MRDPEPSLLPTPTPDDPPPAEALKRARALRDQREFRQARRVLWLASLHPDATADDRRRLGQLRANCTCKDEFLPAEARFDRAMKVLHACDPPGESDDPETLGLAGAIEKRRWDVTASGDALEASSAYYRRGAELGVTRDNGYTAINAAFVLDALAARESALARRTGLPERASASARRDEAAQWRRAIVEHIAPIVEAKPVEEDDRYDWWVLVTLAEASFGLGDYADARRWIELARRLRAVVPRWEFESTVRQLAALATLQDKPAGEGARALRAIFEGDDLEGVRSALVGRVGLGLSGGGFRASFFHLGMLARLRSARRARRRTSSPAMTIGSVSARCRRWCSTPPRSTRGTTGSS